MKRITVVYGTRPEVIKLAPVILALQKRPEVELTIVNTGQHIEMTSQVEIMFGIQPTHRLEIMTPGQSLNTILLNVVGRMEQILLANRPDLVILQGDTSTVMATGICCYHMGILIAHVEAGLRSFDLANPFPEEFNRRIVSIFARFNFAPTSTAAQQLRNEGVEANSIYITGNTIVDAIHLLREKEPYVGSKINNKRNILVTAHRRENHGEGIRNICQAILALSAIRQDIHFIWPVHPNPNVKPVVEECLNGLENVQLLPPLPYNELTQQMKGTYLIWTDSGGVQEEAPSFKKPVLILRNTTERPEVIEAGFGILVDTNPDEIIKQTIKLLDDTLHYQRMVSGSNPFGDGMAAQRIVDVCLSQL